MAGMKIYFENLFDYESWANNEIVKSLISIDEPPEKAMTLMSHIIDAQILWLCRIKNTVSDIHVWQTYSKSEMSPALQKSSSDLKVFINNITGNGPDNVINYANTKGEKFKSSLKDILTHLLFHSAYHRGQIILLIKPLVISLPYTDYIHFERSIKNI